MTTDDAIRGLGCLYGITNKSQHEYIDRAANHIRVLAKWQTDAQAAMVEVCNRSLDYSDCAEWCIEPLAPFLPAKPDPLDELFAEAFADSGIGVIGGYHAIEKKFRTALAKHGLKIVEAE